MMTDAELDDLWKRAQSGNRIFRSATVLKLLDQLDRWRKWRPNATDLRELQEQARDRSGGYQNSLAASAVYIGALETALREATEKLPPPVCPDCGRPMTRREPWVCNNCGEDWE